jgi:WD40 repeat protein
VWNAATLQQHKVLEGLAGQVGGLAFSPDSNVLACVSTSDGTVWLWNVSSGEPMLVIPLAADACTVECIAFHPNGAMLAAGGIDWLATGGSDGALCLWDVAQRAPIFTFNRGATALAFHPSGRWLASASLDESVWMWDITAQKPAFELTGHSDEVTCVAYSPDGRWLVSGSDDRSIRIWNAESGDLVAVQQMDTPIKAVCFSPDGRFLFTGNGNTTSYQIEVRVLTDEARPALADKP